jgi:hypothetical protein
MSNRVAIVGIGQTTHSGRRPYVNDGELIYDAVTKALADADLSINDMESVMLGNMDLFEGHSLNDAMLNLYSGKHDGHTGLVSYCFWFIRSLPGDRLGEA